MASPQAQRGLQKKSSSAAWLAATREIENYDKYDYILINDDLEESIEKPRGHRFIGALAAVAGGPFSEDTESRGLGGQLRLANVRERVRPILASFGVPATIGTFLDFAVSF